MRRSGQTRLIRRSQTLDAVLPCRYEPIGLPDARGQTLGRNLTRARHVAEALAAPSVSSAAPRERCPPGAIAPAGPTSLDLERQVSRFEAQASAESPEADFGRQFAQFDHVDGRLTEAHGGQQGTGSAARQQATRERDAGEYVVLNGEQHHVARTTAV